MKYLAYDVQEIQAFNPELAVAPAVVVSPEQSVSPAYSLGMDTFAASSTASLLQPMDFLGKPEGFWSTDKESVCLSDEGMGSILNDLKEHFDEEKEVIDLTNEEAKVLIDLTN